MPNLPDLSPDDQWGAALVAWLTHGHNADGSHALTETESQITNLVSDLAGRARMGGRSTFSNADYPATAADKYIAQIGTLSTARTVTLPKASTVVPGYMLFVNDESGTVTGTNKINLAPISGDSVVGLVAVTVPYKAATCISDGVSKWVCAL